MRGRDLDQVAAVARSGWFWMHFEGRAKNRTWGRLNARSERQGGFPPRDRHGPLEDGLASWGLCDGALQRQSRLGWGGRTVSGFSLYLLSLSYTQVESEPQQRGVLELYIGEPSAYQWHSRWQSEQEERGTCAGTVPRGSRVHS